MYLDIEQLFAFFVGTFIIGFCFNVIIENAIYNKVLKQKKATRTSNHHEANV